MFTLLLSDRSTCMLKVSARRWPPPNRTAYIMVVLCSSLGHERRPADTARTNAIKRQSEGKDDLCMQTF